MKFGLSKDIYNKIKNVVLKYSSYEFKIYGSRARGDFKKESDVDIAVFGNINEEDKMKILNDFDLLDVPYMIDIVFFNELQKQELKYLDDLIKARFVEMFGSVIKVL